MSDHLYIEPGQLVSSSYDWQEHADRLDGAAERTAAAGTGGFALPEVAAAASSFTQRWVDLIGSLRDTSRAFEDKMLAASQAYISMDADAASEFEAWLLSMGEDS